MKKWEYKFLDCENSEIVYFGPSGEPDEKHTRQQIIKMGKLGWEFVGCDDICSFVFKRVKK